MPCPSQSYIFHHIRDYIRSQAHMFDVIKQNYHYYCFSLTYLMHFMTGNAMLLSMYCTLTLIIDLERI